MAFDKQTENAFLKLTLMMALITFPVIATTNIDCNGKAFYCVNSTHFKICVDFGGVSKTVDDFLIACPASTVCSENNYFECEYPISTISATVPVQSDVTNEITEKTIPGDLFEVTTFLPVNNHEKSVEFVDQWTKTSIETVSQDEVIETTDKENYTPVNEVILNTKNVLHNTTLSESAKNSPRPIDLIVDSEFSTTAAIDVIKDNLSAITTGATTVDHSRAGSELLNDSLNTIVTTPSSKAHTDNLPLTKIISPTIIDYMSTKILPSGSYLSSDLTKTVITTPKNNEGDEYVTSNTSLVSTVNVGDLSSNSSLAEDTNKVTGSDISIDLLKFDITASSHTLEKVESNTESAINHTTSQNVVQESSISDVTMTYDSYLLSSQQDITVNPISETVTDAKEFLTNDEMETPRDRLNDSSDVFGNNLDDISMRTTKADTDQMELDPTTDKNVTLNFTADGFSLKNSLSSQLVDDDFSKAESITTLSDSATSTNHVSKQKSTETSLNLPTPKTNDVTKSYKMVNPNNEVTPITSSPLVISESHLVSESIFNSSTDEISTSDDFYEEISEDDQLNNMTETNINVLTTAATILSDFYTNIGQNSSRVGVNDSLLQDKQITEDTDINSQTTTTTEHTFYADIKENTAQGDLLTQSPKNMTEADINLLTTTPTNVHHLNILNNTFQVWINTSFTQSQQNMTDTAMNSITTTKPTVGDYYTDIINNSLQIGATATLMQTQAESTEEETDTDVNFLTTTITNKDEFYSNIVNNTSQAGASASFTQSQHEMTETDMNFQTNTISNVDNFYTNIINFTTEVGVLDLLVPNQMNMTEADLNFSTTSTTNVDELYSNIAKYTAHVEVNPLLLQNQQNLTEVDINFVPIKIPTEGDFYTNIQKDTMTQAGQKDMTDANFLVTTPTNSDYLNITNKTSQIWVNTLFAQSMTEADINLLTTTITPTVGDFYTDIINNTSQLGVTNTRIQSQQSMTEADINLLITTTTPTVDDIYTDNNMIPNTFQLGVTNTRMQSEQSMTEADINLLTTTTPTVDDFYTDIINYRYGHKIGVTNIRLPSQQSMTEADNNLLTTTTTSTVENFYSEIPKSISGVEAKVGLFMQSRQNVTEPNKDFLTTSTAAVEIADIWKNTSHVEVNDLYIHENVASDLPNAKFSDETDRNNDLLDTTTTVNAVLKDTKELSDDINKSGNVEFSTPMSPSDISLTITTESYVGNTQKSTNGNEFITYLFKKINNDTSQGLHETSTNKFLIDKIIVPLSPHVDYISTIKTHTTKHDNYDSTTAINIALNTTADEFTRKATKAFLTEINDNHQIINNILTNPNNTDFFKANIAFTSLPTKNIQHHSTTAIADAVHTDVTIKDDYEGIKDILLKQNDSKSTTDIVLNTSKHDIDTRESTENVPETKVTPQSYGNTEQTNMELIKTQRKLDHLLFSNEEIAIFDNSRTELPGNESDTFNEQIVSEYQLNWVEPVNDDKQIANRDQDIANANTNITVTWKPQTNHNHYKNTPTSLENTIDGTDVNTNLDISISKAILRNVPELLSNKIETDRESSGISNNNSYLSTESLNNVKIYKNELPETITESSIAVSNNLEKPQMMFSGVENITTTVTDKNVDFKTNNTKGSDELSAMSQNLFTRPSINIIHTISSSEQNNNIKSILQTKVTELPFTTPLNAFVTTVKPRPAISDFLLEKNKSNKLRTTFQLRDTIVNNTTLEKDMKNSTNEKTSDVTKVSNKLLEMLKINTTKNNINSTMKERAALIPQTNPKVTKNVDLVLLPRPTLLTKNLNRQVLSSNSKNSSNTFNTSEPRLILKEQMSNINGAGDDQKNTYDNGLHKTVNIDNASKNVSKNSLILKAPVVTMQDKSTEQTTKLTFDSTNKNGLFSCSNRFRGKYSDKNNCQNFYICIGRYDPIYGKCPSNTVFSEITKQCTRNLSHCIRNNQFKCISSGRYIDIFSDQFYFICVPKGEGYLRFKLKCQKGYRLDKTKLQCVLDSCNGSRSSEESSKNDSDNSKRSTAESKSSKSKEGQPKFSSKSQTEDFECKREGKFEYPDDCRKYYVCTRNGKSGFKRKIKKCDSDEVFDSKKRKCVDDDSYECKS